MFYIFHFLQCDMVLQEPDGLLGFGNFKSPFVNISCHLQGEKLPDFNAFPVNLH